MTREEKMLDRIAKAIRKYRRTGARDLPSVKKSVPSAFKNAVDDLVAEIDAAFDTYPEERR